MKVPTIWIRNPKTGDRRKVNLSDWASDLGRGHYRGWTAISDELNVGTDPKADPPKQTVHEVKRSPGRPKKSVSQMRRSAAKAQQETPPETSGTVVTEGDDE